MKRYILLSLTIGIIGCVSYYGMSDESIDGEDFPWEGLPPYSRNETTVYRGIIRENLVIKDMFMGIKRYSLSHANVDKLSKAVWLDAKYMLQAEPRESDIDVMFFDIDHDGIPEALVTYGHKRAGISFWDVYQFKNEQWKRQGVINAYHSDFYALTEKEQKSKLLIIHLSRTILGGKVDDYSQGTRVARYVYNITTNENGYFRTVSMPEYEFEDILLYEEKGQKNIPEFKLKSPNDKLERIEVQTFYPVGKTVIFEQHDDDAWGWARKMTFVKNYEWTTPVKTMLKTNLATTNSIFLPAELQNAIQKHNYDDRRQSRPKSIGNFNVLIQDLNGDGQLEFIVPTFMEGYDIFKRTGEIYSHIGRVREEFVKFTLHEKTNGWHSIECSYPVENGLYIRDLYVYDGKRYSLTVRSWVRNGE